MGEQVLEPIPRSPRSGCRCRTSTTSWSTSRRSGCDNDNEVYYAADRPYGLIEGTVTRDDAPPAGRAWQAVPGF